jgi:hypothetical protein
MTLDDWIERLEIQNYNSNLSLDNKQAMQILRFLRELRRYRIDKEKNYPHDMFGW